MGCIAVFDFLKILNPTTWVIRAVSALVLAGALWWAWTGFKGWVAAPLVIQAEAKKDDFYIPKLKAYEADFKGLTAQIEQHIKDTNAATEKKLQESKHEADRKTKQYRAELATQKLVSEQIANERIAAADFNRLLNNVKTPACNGAGGQPTADSGRADRFRELYQQCESALEEANGDAAAAIDRASKAVIGLKAVVN
jgi:ElaB/YqjD/DUF883 family membrane-anchored ribosome-binding protein